MVVVVGEILLGQEEKGHRVWGERERIWRDGRRGISVFVSVSRCVSVVAW